ncbi:hypothetical protein HOLleu_16161 [Holothuria leucospilota]|uniref:LRRNT domain-containing protein n=1 Tax=Holothuria leucospilota TaxID=206669 RepID=A0A9Q1C3P1_HOLLE|nr:hypothetical protein HOLleu_16161 [Holothuria leucospilota]
MGRFCPLTKKTWLRPCNNPCIIQSSLGNSVCDNICNCSDEIFVNCSSRDLTEVPHNIPGNVYESK